MVRGSAGMRLLTMGVLVVCGCSAEAPIRSKADALKVGLERIEALQKAFPASEVAGTREQPLVVGGAPFSASNTLVISETDLGWWSRKPVCTKFFDTPSSTQEVNCRSEGPGDGVGCASEIASVVRFGTFRDPHEVRRRDAVERCVTWFSGLQYVVLLRDETRGNGAHSDTSFTGTAAVFDLKSGQGLARLPLHGEDNKELGGEDIDRNGRRVVHVVRDAAKSESLARQAVKAALVERFPSADVSQFP